MPVNATDYRRVRSSLRFTTNNPGAGNHYFVGSAATGASATGGYTPDVPATTLDYAIGLCTAAKGDTIHVMPGHAENVSAAAAIAADISGISIIGYGNGRLRPTFTFDTVAGASFDITAANITIQNIVCITGVDAITAMFNVNAADVAFENCEFQISNGTLGSVLIILTAATAARLRVERCNFFGPATSSGTTTTACIDHEVGVDYTIRENYFTGKMTQAITNGATVLRGLIDNNRFVIATGTKAINMAAASTPFISNNRINVPSGTAPVVAAAGFMAGNVYSAAAGVTAGTASTF